MYDVIGIQGSGSAKNKKIKPKKSPFGRQKKKKKVRDKKSNFFYGSTRSLSWFHLPFSHPVISISISPPRPLNLCLFLGRRATTVLPNGFSFFGIFFHFAPKPPEQTPASFLHTLPPPSLLPVSISNQIPAPAPVPDHSPCPAVLFI